MLSSLFGWLGAIVFHKYLTAGKGARVGLLVGLFLSLQIALSAKEVGVVPCLFVMATSAMRREKAAIVPALAVLAQLGWYLGQKLNAASGVQANAGYAVSLSLATIQENLIWYTRWGTDFFWNEPSPTAAALAIVAMAVVLMTPRTVNSVVAVGLLLASLAFYLTIFRRNGYVFYVVVPLVGIALAELMKKRITGRVAAWLAGPIFLAGVGWVYARGDKYANPLQVVSAPMRQAREALAGIPANAPKGTVYVVEDDPFPLNDYTVQMLMALHNRDVTIAAVRVKFEPEKAAGLKAEELKGKSVIWVRLPSEQEAGVGR